jgi:hypothetical protein
MIRVFTARSGAPTLSVDDVAVHSSYDPVREAARFAADSLGGESPATVVVLGEGIGHVTDAVRGLFPAARVIPVVYSAEVFRAARFGGDPPWYPGCGTTLSAHLRARLADFDVDGLRVLEWPPSARIYPAVSRAANEDVRQVVQEMNGSLVTTVATGRLWVRNTLANLLGIEEPVTGRPCDPRRPLVIAASGPSLEAAAGILAAHRGMFDLWALPSACGLLEAAGVAPDLVIMTDPGFYSLHHLWFTRLRCPVALPLSAARGCWSLHGDPGPRPFLLSQPSFFESSALGALGISAPTIAPHGTVAATAIDLALSATDAPVILAGLDMCSRDLLSHGRPNAFDALLRGAACRTEPHTSLLFARSAQQRMEPLPAAPRSRISPSLRVYAGWLDEASRLHPGRLVRLLPSPVALGGMAEIDAAGFRATVVSASAAAASSTPGNKLRPVAGFPSAPARRTRALALLDTWERTVSGKTIDLVDDPATPESAATGFAICAVLEPRLLLEARRRQRTGDAAGAAASREAMVASVVSFLRQLGDRIRGAA